MCNYFDRVNDDLVVEILQRLSMKRINRCKCVSKRWYNLISSPSFVTCYNKHRNMNKTNPFFGLFYQSCRFYDNPHPEGIISLLYTKSKKFFAKKTTPGGGFSLGFLPQPIRVLASSNGLVLCSDALTFQNQYYVCNPLTKIWLTIPPPPSAGLKWARVGFICNDTDIVISSSSSSSCSFVIVRFANFGEENEPSLLRVEIYTSQSGRWAEHDLDDNVWTGFKRYMFWSFCNYRFATSGLNAVVCNGLLHWRGGCQLVFVYDPNNNNNNSSKYRVLKQPEQSFTRACYLGEHKGNLMYITFEENRTFTMWELIDYGDNNGDKGEEWGLLHKVCLDQMVFNRPGLKSLLNGDIVLMSFLAFHPFDRDVVFFRIQPYVVSCNMKDKTIKKFTHVVSSNCFSSYSMPYLVMLPWLPLSPRPRVTLPAA